MICFLKGKIAKKQPTRIELDVSGVGYEVIIPLSTYEALPGKGKEIQILIHNLIREDANILYGFMSEGERELFRMVIQISRIGPKVALAILSRMSEDEFKHAVISEDSAVIAGISGIGKKTAERIIMELKEKLSKAELPEKISGKAHTGVEKRKQLILQDAIIALEALGYKRQVAYSACFTILRGKDCLVEELIRLALRRIR